MRLVHVFLCDAFVVESFIVVFLMLEETSRVSFSPDLGRNACISDSALGD